MINKKKSNMKKLLNYKLFNEQRLNKNIVTSDTLNEGLIQDILSRVINKLTGWSKTLATLIKNGKSKIIKSGPNAGKPAVMPFFPEAGSVADQFARNYKPDTDEWSYDYIVPPGEQYMNESIADLKYANPLSTEMSNIADVSAGDLVEEIADSYKSAIRGGYNKPIFIYGAPGIGKTQIIQQVAREINPDATLICVDLQFMMPEDFKGVPTTIDAINPEFEDEPLSEDDWEKELKKLKVIASKRASGAQPVKKTIGDEKIPIESPEVEIPELSTPEDIERAKEEYLKGTKPKMTSPGEGVTRANLPWFFPRDEGKNNAGGILFFDEMNRANKFTYNSLMNFLGEDRRIDNYFLPKGWIIVAAGNRKKDDETFFRDLKNDSTALVQRFQIFNFLPKFEDWANWARKQPNILPELVDFLEMNIAGKSESEDFLWHTMPKTPEAKVQPWPSPRTWTQASKLIAEKAIEYAGDWRQIPENSFKRKFDGSVGQAASNEFMAYLDVIRKISLKEINEIENYPSATPWNPQWKNDTATFFALVRMLERRIPKVWNGDNATKLANLYVFMAKHPHAAVAEGLIFSIIKQHPQIGDQSLAEEGIHQYIDAVIKPICEEANDPSLGKDKSKLKSVDEKCEEIIAETKKYIKSNPNVDKRIIDLTNDTTLEKAKIWRAMTIKDIVSNVEAKKMEDKILGRK